MVADDSALDSAAQEAIDNLGNTADQFGTNVATATRQPESSIASEVMRDCTKEGLSDAAWDVWWSYDQQEPVDISQMLVNVTAGCLHTYTEAPWPTDYGLARTLTYYVDQSVGAVVRYQADAATVSNWLVAVRDAIPN